MKCIVTGGCGFLGSHLVERLLTDNHSVIVIDNLSTGNLDNIKKFTVPYKNQEIDLLNTYDWYVKNKKFYRNVNKKEIIKRMGVIND